MLLLHGAPLWLLGAALGAFVLGAFRGPPSHSLSYFYLHLPEPSRGPPQFSIRSYLDNQPIARFDSLTGKMEPLVPWMEDGEKEAFLSPEWVFRTELKLSKLDLLAGEPPVGKVTRKMVDESLEILTCQAFGFYPKEIQATWRRDGEIWEHETFHRNMVPNSDGTYYVRLSIEINPKERDHFRCHLEHEGLQEPLDLAFKEERGWLIPVVIVAGLLPVVAIPFLICWFGRRHGNNHYQEVAICHDQAPSQRGPPPPKNEAEDEIRSPLLPQSTSEHKASYGVHRSQSDPEASVSPLCRQEKGSAK